MVSQINPPKCYVVPYEKVKAVQKVIGAIRGDGMTYTAVELDAMRPIVA